MSNVQAVALNSTKLGSLAQDHLARGGAGVNELIDKAIVSYKVMAGVLHQAACAALYHATETGDSRPLTKFFNGLRQNDRDGLRVWLGKIATITHSQEDGSEVETKYLTYKKDAGFVIKKGTQDLRAGYLDIEKLLASPSFQDVNQDKEKPDVDLVAIMAMLAKIEAKTKKKATDNDVKVPEAVLKQLASLSATVAAQMQPATDTKQ